MDFTYDGLDRLTSWTIGLQVTGVDNLPPEFLPQVDTSYKYDTMGNIVRVEVNGKVTETAHYGTPQSAHAVASDSVLGSFQYDTRGRQVGGMGRTTGYTNFDLPRSMTTSQGTTTFDYDASGLRVRKEGPDGTTVSLATLFERRQPAGGGAAQDVFYVKGAEATVAEVVFDESAGTQRTLYLGGDSLGSVLVVFDDSGSMVESRYFDPWGNRIDAMGKSVPPMSGDPVALGFAGQRSDDDLGIVDMTGRIYDPVQRRFITADTVVPKPNYGQAYNRWIYVYDNPLGSTDPSGHNPCEDDGAKCPSFDPPPEGAVKPRPAGPGARNRPGRAPGNNPAPAGADAATPGGNDPRNVGDFAVSHEGVNGDYSSEEAWKADRAKKNGLTNWDRILYAAENAVVNMYYDSKTVLVRLNPQLYDGKGEDMAGYIAGIEEGRSEHLTIPDQATADLTRDYSFLGPFVLAWAGGGKSGGAAFAEQQPVVLPWVFGQTRAVTAALAYRAAVQYGNAGDVVRVVRPRGFENGAKFTFKNLDYYPILEQGGFLKDPISGKTSHSIVDLLREIGIDPAEVDTTHAWSEDLTTLRSVAAPPSMSISEQCPECL
jgi:RHS repeat-associated protein